MMRERAWLVCAVVACGLLGLVSIQRGSGSGLDWSRPFNISGVEVGMTTEQVISHVGEPRYKSTSGPYHIWTWENEPAKATQDRALQSIMFDRGHAIRISGWALWQGHEKVLCYEESPVNSNSDKRVGYRVGPNMFALKSYRLRPTNVWSRYDEEMVHYEGLVLRGLGNPTSTWPGDYYTSEPPGQLWNWSYERGHNRVVVDFKPGLRYLEISISRRT